MNVLRSNLLVALSVAATLAATEPVRLNLNENAFGPSPAAVEAIQHDLANLHRYTTPAEADALIQLLAAKEGVAPGQIVPGELLEQLGLQLSLRGGPGGEFIYSVPGYPVLAEAAVRVGGVAVAIPLNERFENDLSAITAGINARTRAVFLVNPHNPTGTVHDAAEFHVFLRTAAQHALVIVDEAYLEFSDDFTRRTAVAHTQAGENVLVYRTFAKAYGLGALPLGYAVAPRTVADFLRQQGLGNPRDINRLAVSAAIAALRDDAYLGRVHRAVAIERDRWHALLDELHLRHTSSQGNFVFFDAGCPHPEIAAALAQAGVHIARAFPPYDRWARISIGLPSENRQAQAALRTFLQRTR